MVILLVVAEMALITKASGHELKEEVVYAKVNIERNTVITENMLELREVDAEFAHPDAVRSADEAVSKRAVIDVVAGEMMLSAKLSSDDEETIGVRDKNSRLFSIRFEVDQANGWQLTENQLVDIICVPNNPDREQVIYKEGSGSTGASEAAQAGDVTKESRAAGADSQVKVIVPDADTDTGVGNDPIFPECVTVLKSIRIVKIIDEYGRPSDASKTDNIPKHISFEVTDRQAAFLAYAKRNGKIEIACIPE